MPFYVELKGSNGKTVYDTTLRNFSLISRQRVMVSSGSGVLINIPNPLTTCPFARIDGNYEPNVCLFGGIQEGKMGLMLAPKLADGGSITRPVIVYFMGVGTTGLQPEYGAVIRNANNVIEWSSLDNPLFIRTAPVTAAAANPGTSLGLSGPIATTPSIAGMASRGGGGSIFCAMTGFSNGLYTAALGNPSGSGNWTWNTSLMPKLDAQVYIDTGFMD